MIISDRLDNFKKMTDASLMPTITPHVQTQDISNNFMKEFDKVEIESKPIDTTAAHTAAQQTGTKPPTNDLLLSEKETAKPEPQKNTDHNDLNRNPREAEKNPSENVQEKNGENKGKTDQTGEQAGENPSSKNKQTQEKTNSDSFKEIITKNQLKQLMQKESLQQAKEGAKENFSETKNLEKVMLKNLEAQSKDTQKNTTDTETKTEKKSTNESPQGNEKKIQEGDIEKKDDKSLLKTESKSQKTNTQENQGAQIQNDLNKQTSLPTEIKIIKANTPSQLLEQYQELKDRIVNNVENTIKFLFSNNENRITMKLYPPELGKVEVELVVKNNHIDARINTENLAVKEAVMSNLSQLRSNLENAGIQINKIDIEVGGFKNQLDQHYGNRKSKGEGGSGGSSDQSGESSDIISGKIINHQPLSYFLGRSINCLI